MAGGRSALAEQTGKKDIKHVAVKVKRLDLIRNNAATIHEIVERHSAGDPRVFGSTARGDDGPNSEIDILVDMKPMMSVFDIIHIQDDLEKLLGEHVDVVVDSGIPDDARAIIARESVEL